MIVSLEVELTAQRLWAFLEAFDKCAGSVTTKIHNTSSFFYFPYTSGPHLDLIVPLLRGMLDKSGDILFAQQGKCYWH